jgi:hypothetical protein
MKKAREREMSRPSLPLRLTFLLSLSLTASYSSSLPFFHKPSSLSPSTPKATPSDLLSLLGPKPQSSTINPLVAQDLKSCLKFLVPFTPTKPKMESRKCLGTRRELGLSQIGARSRREEDELIWWPPEPVLELARLAVDSGGDPAAIHRALDPTIIAVSFVLYFFFPVLFIDVNALVFTSECDLLGNMVTVLLRFWLCRNWVSFKYVQTCRNIYIYIYAFLVMHLKCLCGIGK